jgi:hypothetical protein
MDRIVWVEMGKLVASPWATIGEGGRWRRVLRGWIDRTGRYEPLVVRPCGEWEARCYEVIHGHGRLRVLRELGHTRVACVVWEVSEVEAMLYGATMNKVRGREVTRRRVALLREIAEQVGGNEEVRKQGNEGVWKWMGERLIETAGVLRRVLGEDAERGEVVATAEEMREAFTVFLSPVEKRRVVEILRGVDRDVATALLRTLNVNHEDTKAAKTHEEN